MLWTPGTIVQDPPAGEVSLEQSKTLAVPDSDRKCLRAGKENIQGMHELSYKE